MKFEYNNNFEKMGIYEIRNIYKNKSYIGQTSKNFKNRWNNHKTSLLNKTKSRGSTNIRLKYDFKKCFEILNHDDFLVFKILEIIEDKTKLDEKEIFWIKKFKKQKIQLYNFNEGGKGMSDEKKQKISESHKGKHPSKNYINYLKGKTFEEVFGVEKAKLLKENISITIKNRPNKGRGIKKTKEAIEKLVNARKKNQTYIKGIQNPTAKTYKNINLLSPEGILYINIECLASFCREHNLPNTNLCAVLKKRAKSYKGWKLK